MTVMQRKAEPKGSSVHAARRDNQFKDTQDTVADVGIRDSLYK